MDKFTFMAMINVADNMLDAGLGQLYHVVDSGEFVGAGVHAAWKPDPNYDSFDTNAIEWLNTGARLVLKKDLGNIDIM